MYFFQVSMHKHDEFQMQFVKPLAAILKAASLNHSPDIFF